MGRHRSYKVPAGENVAAIFADAISPSAEEIMIKGLMYKSRDMKIGIDILALKQHREMIMKLMVIDPRGGHFDQPDIELGLKVYHDKPLYRASLQSQAHAASPPLSLSELVADQAYTLRVMLSHTREKANQFKKLQAAGKDIDARTHPEWLREIYSMMDLPTVHTPTKTTESKRQLCTFSFFRFAATADESSDNDDGDDGDDDDDARLTVVWEGFSTEKSAAIRRISNGMVIKAAEYKAGDSGFITAIFTKPPCRIEAWTDSLELEITNSKLCGGKITVTPCQTSPCSYASFDVR